MAKVKWQKRAERELYKLLVNGFLEFGGYCTHCRYL